MLAVVDMAGRELEHHDLEKQEDEQDLAEVAGEDLAVAQDEERHAGQGVGDVDREAEAVVQGHRAADAAQAEERHQHQQPAEDAVVAGVEVALEGERLGQQHELVEGGGFHGGGST